MEYYFFTFFTLIVHALYIIVVYTYHDGQYTLEQHCEVSIHNYYIVTPKSDSDVELIY